MDTTALPAHETHCMAVVMMHHRIVFVRQVTYPVQLGYGSVHGKHAIGGDQDPACASILCLLQLFIEFRHIIVLVSIARGPAQTHSIDYGCVIELIGNDCIFLV